MFETVYKFNGTNHELIEPAQLKQIAGRAGRFRTAAQANEGTRNLETIKANVSEPSLGLVTTLEAADLPFLRRAMQHELDPIMTAGIFPPTNILTRFANYYPPSTRFSYILLRLHELSLNHPRYHLCNLRDQTSIADAIQPIENLSIQDRMIFCAAPASLRGPSSVRAILQAFAECVGNRSNGALLEISALPLDILDQDTRADRDYMLQLEILHKALILYLWLSYRFAGVFISQEMAFYAKGLVEDKIDTVLAQYSSSPAIREKLRKLREEALRQLGQLDNPTNETDASLPATEALDIDPPLQDLPSFQPVNVLGHTPIKEQFQPMGGEASEIHAASP